jgi:hypothetical protein
MSDKSLSMKKTHGPFTRHTLSPKDSSSSSQAFNRRSTEEGTKGNEPGTEAVEEFKPSDIYFGAGFRLRYTRSAVSHASHWPITAAQCPSCVRKSTYPMPPKKDSISSGV